MILLVPISSEVPRAHRPTLWPGLVMVIVLGVAYLETKDILNADAKYIESLQSLFLRSTGNELRMSDEVEAHLKLRPLLKIAPAPGTWDLARLILGNFLHGNLVHLALNLIGIFAAARICSTFIPFACVVAIFILGGSCGLMNSIYLSREISNYIPHIGSSGGIFSLLGTYYVYNFRFRTRYFIWIPSRRGVVALRTSWFFFLDVLLLELLLSVSQLVPGPVDSIDHLAHVSGFIAGITIALALRTVQRWPQFLQTRGEFFFWSHKQRPGEFEPVRTPFLTWLDLLDVNPYNDQLKIKLCTLLEKHSDRLLDSDIAKALHFFSPTFIRLYTTQASSALKKLVLYNRPLAKEWLSQLPYDSVIRIAKEMAYPAEEQYLLYEFVVLYRGVASPERKEDRKLELLITKLGELKRESGVEIEKKRDETNDTSTLSNNPPTTYKSSSSKRATKGS